MIHRILALFSVLALGLTAAWSQEGERPRIAMPVTGDALPGLEHLDRAMQEVLREQRLVGGSFAVAKDGRLLFARGYGFANLGAREPVQPGTLFNIASCTKAFTGAALLRLAQTRQLDLDSPILDVLHDVVPNGRHDPRLRQVTIRHLLYHAGGFIRDVGHKDEVQTIRDHVRVGLREPLDFDPGSQSRYSNFGFEILKLVVADVSGEPYPRFVQEQVLRPAGITDMRLDVVDGYVPGEARRYAGGKMVEGGHHAFRFAGCWLASSVDMVRFLSALDGSRDKALLMPAWRKQMTAAPAPPFEAKSPDFHPGLGWDVVRQTEAGIGYSKNGGLAGIATLMGRLPNGVVFGICFNGTVDGEARMTRPYQRVRKAMAETESWPSEGDLWEKIR